MIPAKSFAVLTLICAMVSASAQRAYTDVNVEMRNIFYHFNPQITVRIFELQGTVEPTHKDTIVVFDDAKSFLIAIQNAKISISTQVLGTALNERLFAGSDSPLKNLQISSENQKLKVKGRLHSKGDVPFEMIGTLSATPDGKVRIHAEHIKALHLPVKGLMDLLGLNISKMISSSQMEGVRAEGDDLILDPQQILPLPRIRGKVSSVQVMGDQVIQIFGRPGRLSREIAGNYMSYRGGELQFGKLKMENSDMDLIDLNPQDWFDFYLDHYREQLSAGYTKITPQFGLRVHMRDYGKLHPREAQPQY